MHRGQPAMPNLIGRRLLIPIVASGLLLAATAGSVFAKCDGPNPPDFCKEVVASLNDGGGNFQAGTLESLVIDLSQGEQPFNARSVVLTFTRNSDGSTLRSVATATSMAGQWTAQVRFPQGGSWTIAAQVADA